MVCKAFIFVVENTPFSQTDYSKLSELNAVKSL
jgi:hypothetical protein